MHIESNKKGFTLVELLVAMAITGIVAGAIFTAFQSQQKSYITQDQVTEMQQNLRAGMGLMVREIRMAGCDPTRAAAADIQTANANSITFTLDITNTAGTGDPDGLLDGPNENITYSLYTAGGIQKLGRKSPSTANNQPVAENIDALDFVYLDSNGAPTVTISDIRSAQITMVARAGREDPGFANNTAYKNQQGTTIYTALNDSFRRRLLSTTVKCRNMGL